MHKIALTIDDTGVVVDNGITILEAALQNGIYIPHLCYHPDLKPAGACRLCWVETGNGQLVTSCRTPVEQGMVVKTKSPEVDKVRRPIVELLLADHHIDCGGCVSAGQCELQQIMASVRIDRKRLRRLRLPQAELPLDTSNPFFDYDPNRCIVCGICVQTCADIQRTNAIDLVGRGYGTRIAPFWEAPFAQSRCESCGECVVRCPVGALGPKRRMQRSQREVKTVCAYCSVGCGLFMGVRGNSLINMRGNPQSPVNKGHLCVRGRYGWGFVHSPDRLTAPLIKKDGEFVSVSWEEARELIANKLAGYKGDRFALIASTKCTNEENYIAQKFARTVMGTNNVDTSARLGHAPSMAGLYAATGLGATTNSLGDLERAASILVIGSNTTESNPVIGLKVKQAVHHGAKLIVVNPGETALTRLPNHWLMPYPGTDNTLIMGMCRVIVDEGLIDVAFLEERCDNFDEFQKSLGNFNLRRVERLTGVSEALIAEAARIYATHKPAAILWSSGITQHTHGTDSVRALTNLALLTGNIGKPGAGLYSLTGQNNTQGAGDMGCLPDFYPGYQPVADSQVQSKLETAWGTTLNPKPGLTLAEVWPAILDGSLGAIYIIGSNPALQQPGSPMVREALKKAEFVVVQDMFLTETAQYADVILPAASFAEKNGTFTNSERRVQRLHQAVPPAGDARPDWQILCDLARWLDAKGFDFSAPSDVMSEIASVAPIYGGISYHRLEEASLQWPCLDAEGSGTPILHTERFNTSNGRAKLSPLENKRSAEVPDLDYPMILTTERSLYHHGMLSQKTNGLKLLAGDGFLKINPKDAADFEITDGARVRVVSRRGEIEANVRVTAASLPGVVSLRIHSPEDPINALANPALDGSAKTPESKVSTVRLVALA